MFNVCRRGPASLCSLVRTANSSFSPALRPSRLPPAAQNGLKPAFTLRSIHATAAVRDHAAQQQRTDTPVESVEDSRPITKFQELSDRGLIHSAIINEITQSMGHQTMTEVQIKTINELLRGADVIAQARTGTGKTLGFLVPLIQNIIKNNPNLASAPRYHRDKARPSDIRGIIISPTRELAEQIAVEAKKLAKRTSVVVQVATGGNSKGAMLRQMQREGCHLLVATPGRLYDLLTDKYSKVAAPDLTTLVLDEADRLLDGGFHDDIEDIVRLLPDRDVVDRQTMLFSATVPREVMGLVRQTLKPDFHFVQTVKEGEQATHEKVPQKIVRCNGFENLMPALLELSKREIARASSAGSMDTTKPFKAIVYFGSTANVQLASEVFQNLRGESGGLFGKHPLHPTEVSAIHGKLSQPQRTRVSERFRRAKTAILFSSDVTARGMDFPGVTHVIQVGLPPTREQYVHRVGRTGRGDNVGEGWILLTELEASEARYRLKGLPLVPDTSLEAASVDMTRDAQLPAELAATLGQIGDATKMIGREVKSTAYLAMMGQMQSIGNKQAIVDDLNQWTRFGWGWEMPPSISHGLASKLGMNRARGLNFDSRPRSDDSGSDSALGGDSRGRRPGGNGSSFGSNRNGPGRRSGGFGDRESGFGARDRRGFGGNRNDYGASRGRSNYGGSRGGDRDYDSGSRGRSAYATELE
ncbi:MAG: hypothetical protein M1818_007112 [Claussenomyces sp. TS43310]|nr:MAG: hypothetical protein M1818_007112 [Claussenomyces sp. TS43310]